MTITLDLDDDQLAQLRARSEREGRPLESVAADLLRRGLAGSAPYPPGDVRNDYQLLPLRPDEPPVTSALIRRLLDESE